MFNKLLPIRQIREFIQFIKFEALILWMACRNKQTPMLIKAIGFVILAYAFSPIDLIPDFIPVIGYLDDLVLLPVLIIIAIKLLPKEIYDQSEGQARLWLMENSKKPRTKWGLFLIPFCWLLIIYLLFKIWW
jgi:uncharacterized membrane protein YkvA (DUF1232 family)